jgi:Na+/melibiose symporter-like transporter
LQVDINKETKDAEEAEEAEAEDEEPKAGLWRLMRENSPEWFYIIIGALCACGMGAVMPIFAVIFSAAVGILSYTDVEAARSESIFYGIMFAILGLGCCLLVCIQGLMFGISGEDESSADISYSDSLGWGDVLLKGTVSRDF